MNNKNQYDTSIFDMNNIGSIQCIAIAKTKKSKDDLLKRAYVVLFSPEENDINCWEKFRQNPIRVLYALRLLRLYDRRISCHI